MEQENIGLLSQNMDQVKEWAPDVSLRQLYDAVSQQTLLTSLKELFGAVCIVGTIFLIFLLNQKFWRKLHSHVRLHIPADTRSAFPVISVQSPVSIQCCWQS